MLKITSCMSEAADPFCRALAAYLAQQLGMKVVFVDDIPWQERLTCLKEGELDVGWICGVDYVKSSQTGVACKDAKFELLAAPVTAGARCQGKPVYFSDVIVRRDSGFRGLEELRGARWVYNEPGSFSGYLVMLHRLAQIGENENYFGEIIESGAHTASIRMVFEGRADVAAVDSTVMVHTLCLEPEVLSQVRVIECFGPYPIPPWVVSRSLADRERTALKQVFLGMYDNPRGRAILSHGLFEQFISVEDADYNQIRRIVACLF